MLLLNTIINAVQGLLYTLLFIWIFLTRLSSLVVLGKNSGMIPELKYKCLT